MQSQTTPSLPIPRMTLSFVLSAIVMSLLMAALGANPLVTGVFGLLMGFGWSLAGLVIHVLSASLTLWLLTWMAVGLGGAHLFGLQGLTCVVAGVLASFVMIILHASLHDGLMGGPVERSGCG